MNSRVQSGKELELIAAILAGEAQLYHRLIRPYERGVYMMSFFYMKNEKDAEDVAQETFVRAFRDLWAFRGDSGFNAWLIRIALNEVKNRSRRQAGTQIDCFDESHSDEMPVTPAFLRSWREIPCEEIEREEIRDLLRQAVAMLPDIQRQIFLLREIQNLSVGNTAQILSISASSVKVSLHRARMMLQRFLAPKLAAINSASVHRDEPHN
jgi:RNA polymerase sigma-70 factor, ECF subfamily